MKLGQNRTEREQETFSPVKGRSSKRGRSSAIDAALNIEKKGGKIKQADFEATGIPGIVEFVKKAKLINMEGAVIESAFPFQNTQTIWERIGRLVPDDKPDHLFVAVYNSIGSNLKLVEQVCTFVRCFHLILAYTTLTTILGRLSCESISIKS